MFGEATKEQGLKEELQGRCNQFGSVIYDLQIICVKCVFGRTVNPRLAFTGTAELPPDLMSLILNESSHRAGDSWPVR